MLTCLFHFTVKVFSLFVVFPNILEKQNWQRICIFATSRCVCLFDVFMIITSITSLSVTFRKVISRRTFRRNQISSMLKVKFVPKPTFTLRQQPLFNSISRKNVFFNRKRKINFLMAYVLGSEMVRLCILNYTLFMLQYYIIHEKLFLTSIMFLFFRSIVYLFHK